MLTPLSVSFVRPCSSCSSCSLPPEQFDPFDPFDPFRISQAFDSYNYLSNSSVSIGSILDLLEHCNALKSISLSEGKSPRGSKCLTRFNSIELFGVYGEYGVFKGVRSVRGFPLIRCCTYNPLGLYEQKFKTPLIF